MCVLLEAQQIKLGSPEQNKRTRIKRAHNLITKKMEAEVLLANQNAPRPMI